MDKRNGVEVIPTPVIIGGSGTDVNLSGGTTAPAALVLPTKTPVNAVAASGVVTFAGGVPLVHVDNVQAYGTLTAVDTPHADDTITIGTGAAEKVYTFKDSLTPAEGEVLIGASAATALQNLKYAINRTDPTTKDGVNYKVAAANPTVTADALDASTLVITAIVAGIAGNAIASVGSNHTTFAGATLSNGVDHVHETVTVGTQEFVFVTERSGAGEVTVGANETDTAHNLITAINADMENVTADHTDGVATITAAAKGVAGNLIPLTASATNTTVSSVTEGKLDGGINGTVGVAREIAVNATNLFVCTATNTIADANWRAISLGSVY